MSTTDGPSRRSLWLVIVLTAIGLVRALLLWSHEPLYAYANSFDQTRYSACFDIYPDRPARVAPEQNSPHAPCEQFRFIGSDEPMCYWSSELAFGALAAGIWHLAESLGADAGHSVRLIGALKLAALLALSIGLSRAWLRRGRNSAAVANAALLAVLFSDPGNTLYLNTFYAEWSALLASYAVFGFALLWHAEAGSRTRFVCLALAAVLLATTKIQHLVLPLALALGLLVVHRWRDRRIGWQASALLLGAVLGAGFQFAQLQREGALLDAIRQYNRADVIFTALLPLVDDKAAFLAEIGVDPACAEHSGKNAWMLPAMPERACPGVLAFGYASELRVLVTNPLLTLRLAGRAVLALNPWVAANIGQVEGRDLARIAPSMFTLGTPLQTGQVCNSGCSPRRCWRSLCAMALGPRHRACPADRRVDAVDTRDHGSWRWAGRHAKQGHLVVNAALAWLIIVLVTRAARSFDDPRNPGERAG